MLSNNQRLKEWLRKGETFRLSLLVSLSLAARFGTHAGWQSKLRASQPVRIAQMADEWNSYDTAAESHDRLAVPSYFDQPAKDLVADIGVGSAARVLDIGTGSGIAAQRAMECASPQTKVVGIDPSLEMLRVARKRGVPLMAVAMTPGLPFRDCAFDRVLAGFVLSHVASYEAVLRDITRVLAPGGRFGGTAWGSIEIEYRAFWQTLAESFVDKGMLAEAEKRALPWEEWFTDPDHLADAFRAAGLRDVGVRRVVYTIPMKIADFLAIRDGSLQARFMRHNLPAEEWLRFKETLQSEFHRRFSNPIDHLRDAFIAIGTRS